MGSSSSSGEDGDEEWRAAIGSIVSLVDPCLAYASKSATASTTPDGLAPASVTNRSGLSEEDEESYHHKIKSRLPKHYQIKVFYFPSSLYLPVPACSASFELVVDNVEGLFFFIVLLFLFWGLPFIP